MMTDGVDRRTLAYIEIALERACQGLANGEDLEARRYIANRILKCAQGGEKTLSGLTEAGEVAATQLCSTHGA
jgi:hypothetical protein